MKSHKIPSACTMVLHFFPNLRGLTYCSLTPELAKVIIKGSTVTNSLTVKALKFAKSENIQFF